MDAPLTERQKLVKAVSPFPDEALAEFASFVDYLRYKSAQSQEKSKVHPSCSRSQRLGLLKNKIFELSP